MSKWTKFAAVALIATMAAACGDDNGGTDEVELSQAEQGELFLAIQEVFEEIAFAPLSAARANPGLSLSVAALLADINETVSCPQGGNTAVTGTVDEGTTTASFDVDFDFNECQSRDFTINGLLTYGGTASETETSVSIDLTVDGGLSVLTPSGASGSCTMDLTYSFDFDFQTNTASGSASGSICGQNFSQEF
jgi:hypothetical protein